METPAYNYDRLVGSPHLNEKYYWCAMSLRSELRLIRTLLKISKRCLCPKLKSYALELHARKVELMLELKIHSKAEKTADSRLALMRGTCLRLAATD
jgi:hypothetical protein